MTNHDPRLTAEPLDALVAQLLDCGGVLSQIITRMHAAEASGLSSPDAVPIPEMAHTLIRDVLVDFAGRHAPEEIARSAEIVGQVTAALCDNIFFVPPAEIRRALDGSRSANARRRRRHRRR